MRLFDFADEVLVRCPACEGRAVVLGLKRPGARACLRCGACGLCKDEFPKCIVIGARVDPYFRLPLWLQAGCRGHVLWAYNLRHLDLLESYVAARLRERGAVSGPMSLAERLPGWMKSAKNRDVILRTINRLKASQDAP